MTKRNLLFELFFIFMKIGMFTFGGGYAMISIIEDACVEKKKWITHDDMMNVTVIAESTPGPIAINCATFIGYRQAGMAGAVCATFGIVMPSFVIIYVISLFLDNFLQIAIIAHAFQGIKVAVGILILSAGIKMLKQMKKKKLSIAILCAAFAAMLFIDFFSLNFSSISLLVIAAVVSLAVCVIRKESTMQKGGE